MIGLLYLVVIFIFYKFVKSISHAFTSKSSRVLFVIVSFGIPIGYLNLYPLYPSYSEFIDLCNSPNRAIVYQSKVSDILYLESLRGKDIESYFKEYSYPNIAVRNSHKEFTQYSKNNNEIEKEILKIDSIPYEIVLENTWLINGTLRRWQTKYIDHELGLMAESNNYIYYPYGKSWAIYLGGSSGSAPSKDCSELYSRVDMSKLYINK
jgi:hypothetical protein